MALGIHYYANGNQYDGEWKNGKKDEKVLKELLI